MLVRRMLASCLLTCTSAAAAPPIAPAAGDPFSLGPFSGSADSLLVSAVDGNIVLVGKNPEGMYRSTDGGVKFSPFGAGLPGSAYLSDLTRDPQDDPRDGERIFGLLSGRVWVSEDFGASWTVLPATLPGLSHLAVATSGSTMLAATTEAVYRSDTGGDHWTTVATGTGIGALVFAPGDSNIAYYGSAAGVFKSVNNGVSFADPGPFSTKTTALSVNPADVNQVFAGTRFGLFRSNDGGLSFNPVTAGLPAKADCKLFAWSPDGARLWAGLENGMWFSDNSGASWQDGNAGFLSTPPEPTEMSFAPGGDIFVGGQATGGLWRTYGPQLPWVHLGFPEGPIVDTLIAGPGGSRVGAKTTGVFAAPAGAGEIKPTAWQASSGAETRVVVADPADSDRWIAGGVGVTSDIAQVVVLTNSGATAVQTYTRAHTGRVTELSFDPFAPGVVLGGIVAEDFGDPAIIRSTDSGDTWVEVPGAEGWILVSLVHDPHTPGRALAFLTDNRWADTADGGLTWTLHPAWIPDVGHGAFLAIDPWKPLRLWRGDTIGGSGSTEGLFRSEDGGTTWQNVGISLKNDSDIQLHPDIPDLLWVSGNAAKLWISGDAGESWDVVYTAFSGGSVVSIALDSSDGTLFIGTTNTSTWELPGASPYVRLGTGTQGTGGFVPRHYAHGGLPQPGNAAWTLGADRMLGGSTAFLLVGVVQGSLPFVGGTLFVAPPWLAVLALPTGGTPGVGGSGTLELPLGLPADPVLIGATIVSQLAVNDAGGPAGFPRVLTNGLRTTFMP